MYGSSDYERRIHRIDPSGAPGAPVRDGGAETPPDVGFLGSDYAGILILGMNPGRGQHREQNERDYFDQAVHFSKARSEQSALRIGRCVLAEERRSNRDDPWRYYKQFVIPLLQGVRTSHASLTIDNIARLNVARSKTVDDSTNLTKRMARICFNAHTREQITLVQPQVIVCRYKRTADWLGEWGADIIEGIPMAVVGGRGRPSHADMKNAAQTIERALKA